MDGVVIRLEIEQMKQTILHHFSQRQLELETEIGTRLDGALKSFNWDKAVRLSFDSCLEQTIRDSIRKVIEKEMASEEVQSKMQSIARKAMTRYLKD